MVVPLYETLPSFSNPPHKTNGLAAQLCNPDTFVQNTKFTKKLQKFVVDLQGRDSVI